MPWDTLLSFVAATTEHPVIRLALVVVAVAALLITLARRRVRRLAYYTSGTSLIAPKASAVPELKFTYKGAEVDRATVTDLVLWNQGNETISRGDISQNDPLRVEVPQAYEILSCRVVRASTTGIGAEVTTAPWASSQADVEFEDLEPGEGVRLQVIHTADRFSDASIAGRVRGVRGGPLRRAISTPLGIREAFGMARSGIPVVVLMVATVGGMKIADDLRRGEAVAVVNALIISGCVAAGLLLLMPAIAVLERMAYWLRWRPDDELLSD